MIKTYSQRITPPFSGQVQIAESTGARALTMDGKIWEFRFLHSVPGTGNTPGRQYQRGFTPVMVIDKDKLDKLADESMPEAQELDERLRELIVFLSTASLPFPPADQYEYWLLDPADESPLALIFSCIDDLHMANFPTRAEWTALPAAVMKIERTQQEEEDEEAPVNYRVERMVAARAGFKPRCKWFKRHAGETESFPSLLLREDWQDEHQSALCQRYLQRQSARLLMLHGLQPDDRQRLEIAARQQVFETERFFTCYPDVVDEKLMKSILVEARLRGATEEVDKSSVGKRRDGVHYL